MGLTRKDKEVLKDMEYLLMVSNEASVPSVKSSSFERVISSNVQNYDNLDGNSRKYSSIKKYHLRRITEMLESWAYQLSGEKVYRPETKQCKAKGCPNPNKRIPIQQQFCSFCGRSFEIKGDTEDE